MYDCSGGFINRNYHNIERTTADAVGARPGRVVYSTDAGSLPPQEGVSIYQNVDNRPVLLMDGPNMLEENMARAHVTRNALVEKLWEANVTHLGQIKAVVFETTGDVSVLHDNNPDRPLDDILIENVFRNNMDSF